MNTVNPDNPRSPGGVPRRERVRAATEAEILQTARELLVRGGPQAVTLREVGRQMGMTASALYRYVEGHADLVDRLGAALFADLGAAVSAAVQEAVPDGGVVPGDDDAFEAGLRAGARAFRSWSLAHPMEFALLTGGGEDRHTGCPLSQAAGEDFGRVFLELFSRGAGVPLDESHDDVFLALPPPLGMVFARTWVKLLGTVMVEVSGEFGHLPVSGEELFEAELTDWWHFIHDAVTTMRQGPPTTTRTDG